MQDMKIRKYMKIDSGFQRVRFLRFGLEASLI